MTVVMRLLDSMSLLLAPTPLLMYKLLVIWERPWIKGCGTAAAERGPGRVVIKAAGQWVSLGRFRGTTPAGAGMFRKRPHCKASGVGLRDSRQVTGHHLSPPPPPVSQSPTAQPTSFHGNGSLPQGGFGLPARPLEKLQISFLFIFLHSCLFFQAHFLCLDVLKNVLLPDTYFMFQLLDHIPSFFLFRYTNTISINASILLMVWNRAYTFSTK